ncbi:MAG: ArsR/SmtB family transcription factor [Minwuia sp.]|uniref:ArsR/SmtB family transcription factor n=1 Tax=Minwuia sp. TaxID=2493630 RepID=UPI003A87CD95
MKEGPDIARLGALIGDPARANMLTALMSGKALTATELAAEAGVTPQTASSHLSRLQDGGLVGQVRQGRHRYFSLAGEDVGDLLESLMGIAARRGHTRTRTGPKDPALRRARVCYDHLAGELAVQMFDSLEQRRLIRTAGNSVDLTPKGAAFVREAGIDLEPLMAGRRPVCRACLDWSARRSHLAGALGAAFLTTFQDRGWAMREKDSRAVRISKTGDAAIRQLFPL